MFLDVFTASHGALPTQPHLGPLAVALDRNWSSGDPVKPPQAPALVGPSLLFCLLQRLLDHPAELLVSVV